MTGTELVIDSSKCTVSGVPVLNVSSSGNMAWRARSSSSCSVGSLSGLGMLSLSCAITRLYEKLQEYQ